MSRSYKQPWIKDPSNRYMKKVAARVYRRCTKQLTEQYRKGWAMWQNLDMDEDAPDYLFHLDPEYPHRNALVNQYTVCDFIRPADNNRK